MAKILIVDEDRLFALTVVHVLSRYGHQTVLADKPSKAAGLLEREEADLLLMEAELAGRKGLQLLKELRQLRPDVPVVLFVDRSLNHEAREQLKKGVFDYINKPFGHEELLVTVERGLERRRLVLSNKQLLSDLEQRVRELSTFNAVARTLNSTLKLKEVLDIVMTKIKALIKAEAWSILMLDEISNELVFEVAVGEKGDQIKEMRLALGQGVAGWVAQQGQPVIVPDVAKDQRFFKGMDNRTGFKTRSIIATPLISRGRLIGVFEIINKLGPDPFNQKDLELLQTLTDHAAIAIENARLYEKAQKLAVTDDLTGLVQLQALRPVLQKSAGRGQKTRQKPLGAVHRSGPHEGGGRYLRASFGRPNLKRGGGPDRSPGQISGLGLALWRRRVCDHPAIQGGGRGQKPGRDHQKKDRG